MGEKWESTSDDLRQIILLGIQGFIQRVNADMDGERAANEAANEVVSQLEAQRDKDFEDEIKRGLQTNTESGFMRVVRIDDDGQPVYEMTDEGLKHAEALFEAHGVDKNDPEQVKAFLRKLASE